MNSMTFPNGYVVVQLDLTNHQSAQSFAIAWFILERDANKWIEQNQVMMAQVVTAKDYNEIILQAVPQPNPAPQAVVSGLPGEICEICQEQVGVTNSRYVLDDYAEGIWICLTCEQEAEEEYYQSEVAQ